mgnify:CR=1 FL=1
MNLERLDKIISELNKTMDELVEKGIFKERNLKKDKIWDSRNLNLPSVLVNGMPV